MDEMWGSAPEDDGRRRGSDRSGVEGMHHVDLDCGGDQVPIRGEHPPHHPWRYSSAFSCIRAGSEALTRDRAPRTQRERGGRRLVPIFGEVRITAEVDVLADRALRPVLQNGVVVLDEGDKPLANKCEGHGASSRAQVPVKLGSSEQCPGASPFRLSGDSPVLRKAATASLAPSKASRPSGRCCHPPGDLPAGRAIRWHGLTVPGR